MLLLCINICAHNASNDDGTLIMNDNLLHNLQLELARPNYMNRKMETFRRCLVMQNTLVKVMHPKIVNRIAVYFTTCT